MPPSKKPTKKSKEFILLNKAGALLSKLYQFVGGITFDNEEYGDEGTGYLDAIIGLLDELDPYYDDDQWDEYALELDKYFDKLPKSKKNKSSKKK